jgi:hypothetical protein
MNRRPNSLASRLRDLSYVEGRGKLTASREAA